MSRSVVALLWVLVAVLFAGFLIAFTINRMDRDDRAAPPSPSPSPVPIREGDFDLSGRVSAASTSTVGSPSPSGFGDAATGLSGSIDVVVERFSETATPCRLRTGDALTIFIEATTIIVPGTVLGNESFPDNIIGTHAEVSGVIQALPGDTCRFLASEITFTSGSPAASRRPDSTTTRRTSPSPPHSPSPMPASPTSTGY